ncbi:deleted in malignant brain tumors 1 protein-like [Mercenaria mercenaria]|uniref:deleted in malignant brain tumors 1 protein-like n=1 Tax=Mercenaria mercenaria TaxID=6596 RepID=UPI00234EC853|nr:deleted in malignant brain tumors 1 protein-like [Mercenaria mercenaria]
MLLLLLVWILALIQSGVVSGNSVLDANGVRLVGGTGPYGGRVEIKINGIWGTICDDSFDIREAKVLCRMMNLSATMYFPGARYGHGIGPIFADRLSCIGYETHIRECSFVTNTLCYHSRDVSIICTACGQFNVYNGQISSVSSNGNVLTTSCNSGFVSNATTVECRRSGTWSVGSLSCKMPTDPGYPLPISDIRLSNGVGLYDGRIEVQVNNTWGTICGSSFSTGEASAICSMLGYSTNYRQYYGSSSTYGQGSGPIYIDKLDCTGSEKEMNKCTYRVNNSCSHSNDAAVACNKNPLNITDIRLVNGTGLYDGRVELFVDGIWGTICGWSINTNAVETLCRMKGTGLRQVA